MTTLYPLKFHTRYKDKIWGGQKINTYLKKDFGKLPNCGETWEISGVPGNISIVANGDLAGSDLKTLIDTFQQDLVGKKVYEQFGNEFPLLIKFIDAHEDLSIQVHPNDELAKMRHQSFGKTEMWYVLQADEEASLISGFNQEINEEIYLHKLNSGNIHTVLNREKVKAGDVFFLPAGRVHTIGKGLLIAEIQQTSDVTYRIYDFDRLDAERKKRELHTEEALAALDYGFYPDYQTKYAQLPDQLNKMVSCQYFETNFIDLKTSLARNYEQIDSFRILICVEGNFTLITPNDHISLTLGECILIPSNMAKVEFKTDTGAKILETYLP